jgi:hypothetical protein
MSENYRAKENIDDNAFLNWLKCLFKLKSITKEFSVVEISPVDFTAQAIIKIFNKTSLNNQVYHVFNPHLVNLTNILKCNGLKILPIEQFIDQIYNYLQYGNYHDLIVKFLLHQGWLDWWESRNSDSLNIMQNKTQYILQQLGFEWLPIADEIFCKYLRLL